MGRFGACIDRAKSTPGNILSVSVTRISCNQVPKSEEVSQESFGQLALRAFKVYILVIALVLLDTGFKPMIDMYISKIPAPILYWGNITSTILDNATLAAVELGLILTASQVKGIMMGVIISGSMRIPGNIPNIIAANKLHISIRAWVKVSVQFALAIMAVYFSILFFKFYSYRTQSKKNVLVQGPSPLLRAEGEAISWYVLG